MRTYHQPPSNLTEWYVAQPKWLQNLIIWVCCIIIALLLCITPKETPEDAQATEQAKSDMIARAKHEAMVNQKAQQIAYDMLVTQEQVAKNGR